MYQQMQPVGAAALLVHAGDLGPEQEVRASRGTAPREQLGPVHGPKLRLELGQPCGMGESPAASRSMPLIFAQRARVSKLRSRLVEKA